MKRNMLLSGCLAALMVLASCEKTVVETDFNPDEPLMVPVTLTGSIPETRVSLDGVTPKWTAGDRLSVFTADGTLCPAFTADQGGSATTTFSGTKPDGSTLGFAIFPYSASISQSGANYTLSLPATQDGTLSNAVMAAKIPAGEAEMVFSNLLTVVRVTIPSGMNVTRIELQRSDRVSGSFTVNGSTLAVTPAASPTDADKRVVVEKSAGFSGEDVLLCVLPSSSKQIDLLLTRSDGKMALVSKTLQTAYEAGHLKKATVPSNLVFSDVAKIGASTASQQYTTTTQPNTNATGWQVKNGDFETWTMDGENLPNYWNSFQTFLNGGNILTKALLAQGYSSSNRQVKRSTDKRPGTSGSYSCRIWARSIAGLATAQGNLTTGRVYASNTSATGTGNYNFTDQDGYATIGGFQNPFHMDFTARPDSMVVWIKYRRDESNTSHPYAKVEAILHDNVDYKSGYNASDCTGGTNLIGDATDQMITSTGSNWVRLSLPFVYRYSKTPNFVLINIATNSYPGGGVANDEMYIDDLVMIYNLYNLRTDANGWATLCLNYKALVPSGATAYYIKKIAGGYAELTAIPAGQVIPANTGVLVKGSANTTYAFNGSAADIKNKTVADVSGNLLSGTTTAIGKPSGTCRVLSSESTASLAAFGAFTGSQIAANTAWLTQ